MSLDTKKSDPPRLAELVVSAAFEYSLRKSTGRRVEGLTDLGFEELLKWLAQSEDTLFRSKLNER